MYIMIGTNDLGYPDFEEFRKNYTKCLAELRKLMPNAIFMSVPCHTWRKPKFRPATM